jgi:hypothetical protein
VLSVLVFFSASSCPSPLSLAAPSWDGSLQCTQKPHGPTPQQWGVNGTQAEMTGQMDTSCPFCPLCCTAAGLQPTFPLVVHGSLCCTRIWLLEFKQETDPNVRTLASQCASAVLYLYVFRNQ